MSERRHQQRGFSLLETVMGIVLITVGLVGVLVFFPAIISNGVTNRDVSAGMNMAQKELERISRTNYNNIIASSDSSTSEYSGATVYYDANPQATPFPSSDPLLVTYPRTETVQVGPDSSQTYGLEYQIDVGVKEFDADAEGISALPPSQVYAMNSTRIAFNDILENFSGPAMAATCLPSGQVTPSASQVATNTAVTLTPSLDCGSGYSLVYTSWSTTGGTLSSATTLGSNSTSISFRSEGSYTITGSIRARKGNDYFTFTGTTVITVTGNFSSVSITPSPSSGSTSDTFTLTADVVYPTGATDTSAPVTYSWTISGGTPSSSTANPASGVRFLTPGTYTVAVTARNSNSGRSGSATRTISVSQGTVAVSSAVANVSPTSGTVNLTTFTFTGSASGGNGTLQYSWDFGDGTSTGFTTTTTATRRYTSIGSYTATMTVRDSANTSNSSTATVYVRVVATPAPTPTPSGTATTTASATPSPTLSTSPTATPTATPYCVADGGTCRNDGDCCSGSCTGGSAKTCAASTSSGGSRGGSSGGTSGTSGSGVTAAASAMSVSAADPIDFTVSAMPSGMTRQSVGKVKKVTITIKKPVDNGGEYYTVAQAVTYVVQAYMEGGN